MALRKYFDEQGFYEIETPILTKSTPEGARDFLVPSRVHPGEFYALPQSPQIFKQILMIAGFDRYVQIARCFRDEALRADRQLEFTQVDLEMSFATPPTGVRDRRRRAGRVLQGDRRRHSAAVPAHAVRRGDGEVRLRQARPALRPARSRTSAPLFAESPFGIFREAVAHGGTVRGFVIPGAAKYSRREVDELVEQAKQAGRRRPDLRAPHRRRRAGVGQGDRRRGHAQGARGVGRGEGRSAGARLGRARRRVEGARPAAACRSRRSENLIPEGKWELTWVTDFPLFDWNADEKRWDSVNHPFTAPREEDLHLLESDPGQGAGQGLRRHPQRLGAGRRQHPYPRPRDAGHGVPAARACRDEEAKNRFGFFLESLEYGTPPHGGLALGLDRICALLAGETSIREVIPFPKTTQAVDLMCDAPSTVDPRQLRELHIRADRVEPGCQGA